MSLNSFLISQIDITKDGLNANRSGYLFFQSWEQFINKDYILHFKKDYFGIPNQKDLIHFFDHPFPVVFYWVDIYSLSNPDEIIRIHFPKGETQSEEFKNLAIYYILQRAKLLKSLTFSDNEKVNDLILNILK